MKRKIGAFVGAICFISPITSSLLGMNSAFASDLIRKSVDANGKPVQSMWWRELSDCSTMLISFSVSLENTDEEQAKIYNDNAKIIANLAYDRIMTDENLKLEEADAIITKASDEVVMGVADDMSDLDEEQQKKYIDGNINYCEKVINQYQNEVLRPAHSAIKNKN